MVGGDGVVEVREDPHDEMELFGLVHQPLQCRDLKVVDGAEVDEHHRRWRLLLPWVVEFVEQDQQRDHHGTSPIPRTTTTNRPGTMGAQRRSARSTASPPSTECCTGRGGIASPGGVRLPVPDVTSPLTEEAQGQTR